MRSILKPTVWGLLLSTCVCLQAQTPRTSRNGQTLAGTWLESVTFQGSTFKVLASFTQDGRGTVLLPFGPGSQGETRVGGLIEWIRTENREFAFTAYFLASEDLAEPLQRSRAKITLDEGLNHWSGPFTYQVVDTNGNILFSGDGTTEATRLTVLPLE
jgi:hypothetical protein